jgi:hypothetical protein
MPFSLPLVAAFLILNGDFKINRNHFAFFSSLSFLVIVSVLISFFVFGSEYVGENIKRAIQFLTSFFYFSFFYYLVVNENHGVISKKIIILFLVFFFLLSALFYFDPLYTNSVLKSLYGKTVTSAEVVEFHQRFAYFFVDPNTAAYFFILACMPLFLTTKSKALLLLLASIMVFCVLTTQSRGGLLVLFLCMALSASFWISKFNVIQKFLSFTVLLFIFIILIVFLDGAGLTDQFEPSSKFNRVVDSDSYFNDSRIKIWTSIVTSFDPYPLGRGYVLDSDGGILKPHSDALRIIYSYGFIAFIIFFSFLIYLLIKFPIYVLPAFVAFIANTLIDEQKFFALFLCLAGILVALSDLKIKNRREIYLRIFLK